MNYQFNNTLNQSISLYIEYKILAECGGFSTHSAPLAYVDDSSLPAGLLRYSSPFKQWVADTGVNAIIPTGFSFGTHTLVPDGSGIYIDYENGGIIIPSGYGKTLSITGTYSVKDFNMYSENNDLEAVILSEKYTLNSRTARQAYPIPPRSIVLPAIFIVNRHAEEKELALGGFKNSIRYFSCVVLGDNVNYIDAVLSKILELKDKTFPLIPVPNYPFNRYGDNKNYSNKYSYKVLSSQYNLPGNQANISRVTASKISDKIKVNENIFAGIADLTVSFYRYT